MERSARRRLVDRADEPDVRRADPLAVVVCDRVAEPTSQRLHRRAVADVLEPLLGGRSHALLLLLDVRHSVAMPAFRGPGDGTRASSPSPAAASPLPILAAWQRRAARPAPRRRGAAGSPGRRP